MGKQTKAKKSENFGKGKVTPVQVAFIVDCYLSDNGYTQTRSAFRTEAPGLVRSSVQEAPKSLLSLGAMLDEYICLKEQKVLVEQERVRLEQERSRIQALLQGMQGVMDTYNSGSAATTPPLPATTTMVAAAPQLDHYSGSSTGCRMYTTPNTMPVSVPLNRKTEPASFYTPTLNQISTNKRKDTKGQERQLPAKRSRTKLPLTGINNVTDSQAQKDDPQCSLVKPSSSMHGTSGSPVQGSSVAKCLFDKPSLSPPSNSQSPRTPPRQVSCQSDKSSNKNNGQQETTTPTNHCTTVISSERLTVSPDKHITYTVERSHCVMTSPGKPNLKRSSSKRDHVKGRLDFDGTDELVHSADKQVVDMASTSGTCQDLDLFGSDLPNFDLFGTDFSFPELLVDLDLGGEGIDFSCEPTMSTDDISGSSHESGDGNPGNDQVVSEFSSSVKVISEDNNERGPETTTTVKAITKCIRIVSPGKSQ